MTGRWISSAIHCYYYSVLFLLTPWSTGDQEDSGCPLQPSNIDQAVFQLWAELWVKTTHDLTDHNCPSKDLQGFGLFSACGFLAFWPLPFVEKNSWMCEGGVAWTVIRVMTLFLAIVLSQPKFKV